MGLPKQVTPGGHYFVTDDDGDIDVWQYEAGFHNGPRCENCNQSWCMHCEGLGDLEQCPANNIIEVHETAPRKALE